MGIEWALGVKIYVPREHGRSMDCPNCNTEIQSDWKVCPSCNSSLEKEKCSKCDRELEIGWVVCPFCPQPKSMIEEELIECVKLEIYGINSEGSYSPYDWGELEGGHVEGFVSIENASDTIDKLVSLHPFSVNDECLTFSIKPKSGEGELGISFDNKKIVVEEYTDSMNSLSKGITHIRYYIDANKVEKRFSETLNLKLKTETFSLKKEESGVKIEPEVVSGAPPTVLPATMTAGMPTSSSNLWHPLFVKDSVYRWEGKKGATILKAKIGRLIIAKEGVIFVSSGSNKIGSQFGKALIPIVGTLMAATSGASTVNLDSTDLSKVGSMKIPKSELTSFLVEGGFMSGRYLRIYTKSHGDYSFMNKIGFNKSDVQVLKQLENINMW